MCVLSNEELYHRASSRGALNKTAISADIKSGARRRVSTIWSCREHTPSPAHQPVNININININRRQHNFVSILNFRIIILVFKGMISTNVFTLLYSYLPGGTFFSRFLEL